MRRSNPALLLEVPDELQDVALTLSQIRHFRLVEAM
jgi:hypothetical protein